MFVLFISLILTTCCLNAKKNISKTYFNKNRYAICVNNNNTCAFSYYRKLGPNTQFVSVCLCIWNNADEERSIFCRCLYISTQEKSWNERGNLPGAKQMKIKTSSKNNYWYIFYFHKNYAYYFLHIHFVIFL